MKKREVKRALHTSQSRTSGMHQPVTTDGKVVKGSITAIFGVLQDLTKVHEYKVEKKLDEYAADDHRESQELKNYLKHVPQLKNQLDHVLQNAGEEEDLSNNHHQANRDMNECDGKDVTRDDDDDDGSESDTKSCKPHDADDDSTVESGRETIEPPLSLCTRSKSV
jgi:hypothetical protein